MLDLINHYAPVWSALGSIGGFLCGAVTAARFSRRTWREIWRRWTRTLRAVR